MYQADLICSSPGDATDAAAATNPTNPTSVAGIIGATGATTLTPARTSVFLITARSDAERVSAEALAGDRRPNFQRYPRLPDKSKKPPPVDG